MTNTSGDVELQQVGTKPVSRNPVAPTSEEGRGDPALTMMWSPEKISGNKRTLAERLATNEVAESSTEEDEPAEESDAEDEEEDSEVEEGDRGEEGDKMVEDTPTAEENQEGELGGTTAMLMVESAMEQATGGLQRNEGPATWSRRQEQVATETGGLDSALAHTCTYA